MNPQPEQALKVLLLADADVAALVVARVYHERAAKDAALPYIVFSREQSEHQKHLGGQTGINQARFALELWADDNATVLDLAEKVRLALCDTRGAVTTASGDLTVCNICIDDEFALPEAVPQGADRGRRGWSQSYIVWHREAVPA